MAVEYKRLAAAVRVDGKLVPIREGEEAPPPPPGEG